LSEGKDVMDDNRHKIEVVDGSVQSDDEFLFSPDIGKLVRRDGYMYTEYGEVAPYSPWVRLMSVPAGSHENYADWSEEYRRAVREVYAAEDRKRKTVEAEDRARRDALVEQARVKLTKEEFDAVFDSGVEGGRGY